MRRLGIYGALVVVSLALYGNTWSAGFVFDDNFAVVRDVCTPLMRSAW